MRKVRTSEISGPAEYVGASGNANPTWRVRLDDGTAFLTVTDGQVGYGINNPEVFGEVEVTLRQSRIIRIRATG